MLNILTYGLFSHKSHDSGEDKSNLYFYAAIGDPSEHHLQQQHAQSTSIETCSQYFNNSMPRVLQ